MSEIKLQLETHKYDGAIGELYHQLVQKDPCHDMMTFDSAINLIKTWIDKSSIKDKTHIMNAIHLMTHDRNGNYDHANHITVEELLPRVMNVVKNFDSTGIDLFLQNLGEISELGSCAQGRTTRLLGFYIPYI